MTRINPNERKVLEAMFEVSGDFGYSGFDYLSSCTGLDRKEVRRAARSLTRKGLAQFARGLWTDGGEPAGSGYACTSLGADAITTGK